MADLTTSFGGLKLKNPFIIGSSGLSDNIDDIVKLEKSGASAVVLKSLFEEEILRDLQASYSSMNSNGFIYPETLDFYENDAPKEATIKYLELVKKAKEAVSIPIIASINCIDSEQWTYFPKQIQASGADALELNIFILPSDLNRSQDENEKTYFRIIEEVLKHVTIPVYVKLSFYFSNLASTLQKLSQTGISGLVLFNRFYNPDIDIDKLEVSSSAILSTPSDFHQSLRWVAIMADRVDCDIAATSGIHSSQTAIKQLLAGSTAVEIVSCIYKNGPEYIQTMINELQEWMDTKGFKNITDFKGKLSQSRNSNPAVYSRVQFMKYFRSFSMENQP